MDRGFYHADRGYWQTTDDVPDALMAMYPDGTIEVPVKPFEEGRDFAWDGDGWQEVALDLATLKAAKLAEIRAACASAITGGFASSALGAAHSYPSSSTDQVNLMGSVTASLLAGLPEDWSTPFWCADLDGVWLFRAHSAAEIQQAGSDGKRHVVACQAQLEMLSAALAAGEDAAAVGAIVWADPA